MLKALASLALLSSLPIACGGRVSDLTNDGGTNEGGPPPGSQDGGQPPGFDGGFTDATPPTPPPVQIDHRGYVVLESTLDNRTYASATFLDQGSPECTFMEPASGCSIQKCPSNGGTQSAGMVTIRGGTQDVTLTPSPGATGSQYKPFDTSGILFPSGSTLTITGAGGVVPGFQGSLVFPAALSVLTPNISMGQTTIIDSSADLVVGWSGGTGQTLVYLQSDAGNGNFLALGCWFDAGVHKAAVPSALLRSFKSQMTSAQNTYLLVFPTARSTVVNGGWGVELFAVGQGPIGQASVR